MNNIVYRIKKYIWATPLYRWYNRRNQLKLYMMRAPYLPCLKQILGENVSIISSNCFAGRIMQDLNMEYNTPTVGLYIWSADYIEFLNNLKYYLTEANLEFVESSKYQLGNQMRAERTEKGEWYPIASLDGKVEVVFLHYHSEEEAKEKWKRRAARVNWDNIFIIGMEQNLCTIEDIKAFDKLPYSQKIFFSTKDIPGVSSNYQIKEFEEEIGNAFEFSHYFYEGLINKFNDKLVR